MSKKEKEAAPRGNKEAAASSPEWKRIGSHHSGLTTKKPNRLKISTPPGITGEEDTGQTRAPRRERQQVRTRSHGPQSRD